MPTQRLNKAFIDKIQSPAAGQIIYRDSLQRGFAIRVTPTSKVFVVDKWLGGKNKVSRVRIGPYPDLSVEQARAAAMEILNAIAKGDDPNALKKAAQNKAVSLGEVLETYLASNDLKPSTIKGYRAIANRCFPDWLKKPITDLTKDMIERRHQKLSNSNGPRGKGEAQANLAMRILRALLTYAANKYEDSQGKPVLADNPVRRLSQVKAWNRVARRQSVIQNHELGVWYKALLEMENELISDYLLLCLLTGLRRNEAAQLKWDSVDLKAKTLTIAGDNTKNHLEHKLPLSTQLFDLLNRRRLNRKHQTNALSPFVFPGSGKNGCLVESKYTIKKLTALSGVRFMVHDLRRTFLTTAESLDIPHYALKKLANHKDASDVTAGYIVANVERLRDPMQRISDHFFQHFDQHSDEDLVEGNTNV